MILSRLCLKLNNGQKLQLNSIQVMALTMKCQNNMVPWLARHILVLLLEQVLLGSGEVLQEEIVCLSILLILEMAKQNSKCYKEIEAHTRRKIPRKGFKMD